MKLVESGDFLEKGKILIIKYWLANTEIINIIRKYNVNAENLIKNYALEALDSYILRIKDENKINSSINKKLLVYFKCNEISTSELFFICAALKNAIVEYLKDLKNLDSSILMQINRVFELNFSEILEEYDKANLSIKEDYKKQKQILIEQSKAAVMGEMIPMIVHQWRQPLQSISILTQKLTLTKSIDGEITDELVTQVANDVLSQLGYMSKTIDDFRDFFLPNKRKENILLSKLIQRVLEFMEVMAKNDSIKINITEKKDEKISIYMNEFVQVMINIIKNARDVMLEKNIKNREINITYSSKNSKAYINVEDNAGGIPEDIKEKIFDSYFSTKKDKDGTGLGLYMSKIIIEKHCNGRLSAENSSKGAIFKIEVPLS